MLSAAESVGFITLSSVRILLGDFLILPPELPLCYALCQAGKACKQLTSVLLYLCSEKHLCMRS